MRFCLEYSWIWQAGSLFIWLHYMYVSVKKWSKCSKQQRHQPTLLVFRGRGWCQFVMVPFDWDWCTVPVVSKSNQPGVPGRWFPPFTNRLVTSEGGGEREQDNPPNPVTGLWVGNWEKSISRWEVSLGKSLSCTKRSLTSRELWSEATVERVREVISRRPWRRKGLALHLLVLFGRWPMHPHTNRFVVA